MREHAPARRGRGDGQGASREARHPLPFLLYQAGLLVLGVLALAFAGENAQATGRDRALPLLYTVMLFWCVVQIGTLALPASKWWSPFSLKLRAVIDLVFCLSIIWLTGGVVSFFLPILFASVLASSALLGRHHSLVMATGATITLVAMTAGQVLGLRPEEWTGALRLELGGRASFLVVSLLGQGIALHLIAHLGSRLRRGIERAEWLNQRVVESIEDGLIVLDEGGHLLLMNHESSEIFEALGEAEWKHRKPEHVFRRERDRDLLEILKDPREGRTRIEWGASRERSIPLQVTCRQVASEAGKGGLWIVRLHDLTTELRAARAEEEVRGLTILEDLSLGLAHEIRNPLASIRGCIQELAGGQLEREQAARFHGIVVREVDRLDRIVGDFMRSASARPAQRERVQLWQCLEEIAESLRGRRDCQQRSVIIDGDRHGEVRGDREQLYQVFLNLGVNAVEASDATGEVRFRIGEGSGGGWVVEVLDRGVGLDPAILGRIFNPFFTTKTREGGLGLTLVERLVHGHGGCIEVRERDGGGTRVEVWLPGIGAVERGASREGGSSREAEGVVSAPRG